MNNYLKTALVSLVVSAVVVSVGFWLVGSQSGQNFGATIGATFFPHSGVGARSFKIVTSTTDNTPATDGVASFQTTHVGAFIEGDASSVITTTSTLTAAQVCTGAVVVANTTGTITLTLPAATSTNTTANCLTNDNDFLRFPIVNNGTNTVKLATSTGDTIGGLTLNATSTASLQLSNSTGTTPFAWLVVYRINSSTDEYLLTQYNVGQ